MIKFHCQCQLESQQSFLAVGVFIRENLNGQSLKNFKIDLGIKLQIYQIYWFNLENLYLCQQITPIENIARKLPNLTKILQYYREILKFLTEI